MVIITLIQYHTSMKIKTTFIFLACFFAYLSYGQAKDNFKNKSEYIEYLNETQKLKSDQIYYISDLTKTNIIKFPSLVFFVQADKIISIDEISLKLKTSCPPKKLLRKLSKDLIIDYIDKKESNGRLILKELHNNSIFTQNNELVALLIYSTRLGKHGEQYIKHRSRLNKLGIKSIILTMDIPYISNIDDYSKINQLKFKNRTKR